MWLTDHSQKVLNVENLRWMHDGCDKRLSYVSCRNKGRWICFPFEVSAGGLRGGWSAGAKGLFNGFRVLGELGALKIATPVSGFGEFALLVTGEELAFGRRLKDVIELLVGFGQKAEIKQHLFTIVAERADVQYLSRWGTDYAGAYKVECL